MTTTFRRIQKENTFEEKKGYVYAHNQRFLFKNIKNQIQNYSNEFIEIKKPIVINHEKTSDQDIPSAVSAYSI